MKTILNPRISVAAALSLFITVNSFAQEGSFKSESAGKFFSYEMSKKFPSVNYNIPGNLEREDINKKVKQNFNKKFLTQTNAAWEQLGDKFLVTFTTDETLTRALFDKTGRMIYSINYCSEKQLPQDVKRLVKNKYEDYKITSAAKVLEENKIIWLIKLAGENDYVEVRLDGDEMSEVENFKKAN
jgi:hypothetical protein